VFMAICKIYIKGSFNGLLNPIVKIQSPTVPSSPSPKAPKSQKSQFNNEYVQTQQP